MGGIGMPPYCMIVLLYGREGIPAPTSTSLGQGTHFSHYAIDLTYYLFYPLG